MTSFATGAIAVRHNGETGMLHEYEGAKEEVGKTTPASHNRLFLRRTEELYRKAVEDCSYGEAEVGVGSMVYYIHRWNLGNKAHPDFVECVEYSRVESVCPQTVILANGHRPFHKDVIAVYTGAE